MCKSVEVNRTLCFTFCEHLFRKIPHSPIGYSEIIIISSCQNNWLPRVRIEHTTLTVKHLLVHCATIIFFGRNIHLLINYILFYYQRWKFYIFKYKGASRYTTTGSIPTRENEIFLFFFPSGVVRKCGVEFRHSTRNTARIRRKVGLEVF